MLGVAAKRRARHRAGGKPCQGGECRDAGDERRRRNQPNTSCRSLWCDALRFLDVAPQQRLKPRRKRTTSRAKRGTPRGPVSRASEHETGRERRSGERLPEDPKNRVPAQRRWHPAATPSWRPDVPTAVTIHRCQPRRPARQSPCARSRSCSAIGHLASLMSLPDRALPARLMSVAGTARGQHEEPLRVEGLRLRVARSQPARYAPMVCQISHSFFGSAGISLLRCNF